MPRRQHGRQAGHRRPGGRGERALGGIVQAQPVQPAVLGRLLVAWPALPGGGQVVGVGPLAVVEAAESGRVERTLERSGLWAVQTPQAFRREALERGFLVNCTVDTVLRFLPPLIVQESEVDLLVGTLDELFAKV